MLVVKLHVTFASVFWTHSLMDISLMEWSGLMLGRRLVSPFSACPHDCWHVLQVFTLYLLVYLTVLFTLSFHLSIHSLMELTQKGQTEGMKENNFSHEILTGVLVYAVQICMVSIADNIWDETKWLDTCLKIAAFPFRQRPLSVKQTGILTGLSFLPKICVFPNEPPFQLSP